MKREETISMQAACTDVARDMVECEKQTTLVLESSNNTHLNFKSSLELQTRFFTFSAMQIKYLVLLLLILQNVATILSMKWASRHKASDGHQALTTSIVVMVEFVKVTVCTCEIFVRYEIV